MDTPKFYWQIIIQTPSRSKTVQNIRRITKEDSVMSTGRTKKNINIKQNSAYYKTNVPETPKIRSKVSFPLNLHIIMLIC